MYVCMYVCGRGDPPVHLPQHRGTSTQVRTHHLLVPQCWTQIGAHEYKLLCDQLRFFHAIRRNQWFAHVAGTTLSTEIHFVQWSAKDLERVHPKSSSCFDLGRCPVHFLHGRHTTSNDPNHGYLGFVAWVLGFLSWLFYQYTAKERSSLDVKETISSKNNVQQALYITSWPEFQWLFNIFFTYYFQFGHRRGSAVKTMNSELQISEAVSVSFTNLTSMSKQFSTK